LRDTFADFDGHAIADLGAAKVHVRHVILCKANQEVPPGSLGELHAVAGKVAGFITERPADADAQPQVATLSEHHRTIIWLIIPV
jgi:hypothetical protein